MSSTTQSGTGEGSTETRPSEAMVKRNYAPPVLKVLGTVADLTRGTGTSVSDGGSHQKGT